MTTCGRCRSYTCCCPWYLCVFSSLLKLCGYSLTGAIILVFIILPVLAALLVSFILYKMYKGGFFLWRHVPSLPRRSPALTGRHRMQSGPLPFRLK